MQVTYNDQDYEFVGYCTRNGTHFLGPGGDLISRRQHEGIQGIAYFCLVPVRHTFGGVVFEETGENRRGVAGEWALMSEFHVAYLRCATGDHYPILKPVEVIDAEDNQG